MGTQRVQQFIGRLARPRQFRFRHIPNRSDVPPDCRVVNQPVSGELIGFLAVFPSALAVALSGQAAVAGVGAAHLAQSQGQVDEGDGRC